MEEIDVQKSQAAEAFHAALAHHQNGRFAEAEHYYRLALSHDSTHSDSLNNLGTLAAQFGHFQLAADLIEEALKHAPSNAQYHFNRASILLNLDQPDQVTRHFICGLILDPAYCAVLTGLGRHEWHQGRFGPAEYFFRRALALDPNSGESHVNLANALASRGALADALVHFHSAESAGLKAVRFTLGTIYHQQGDLARAEHYYRHALDAGPGNGQIGLYLGNLLVDSGRLLEAVHYYRFAAATAPVDIEPWSKLSQLLFRLRGYEAAAHACHRILRLDAHQAEGYLGQAKILQAQQNWDLALFHAQQAVALTPDGAEISQLIGTSFGGLGFVPNAITWTDRAVKLVPDIEGFRRLYRAMQLYDPHWLPPVHVPQPELPHEPDIKTHGAPIRLGYVSSDFLSHPVARCVFPLLAKADRAQFHITCFADIDQPDHFTDKLKAQADDWISITGLDDKTAAARIRQSKIDIAIYLAGSFDRNRPGIAAFRAAPVQVSLHDGMTSGIPDMDYLITDPILAPRSAQPYFAERLARLPHLIMQMPIADPPDPGPLPLLRGKGLSLGSFNNPVKINDAVLALWGACLRALPDSTLTFVYRNAFDSRLLRARILRALDVVPERIIFTSGHRRSYDEHLALYRTIDVSLDPFPFSGYTVSFESLSMGVPVMTLPGATMGSRWTMSLLDELGLLDFAAQDHADFSDKIVGLESRIDQLIRLRQTLPELVAASHICRTDLRVRHFERLFKAMYFGFGRPKK